MASTIQVWRLDETVPVVCIAPNATNIYHATYIHGPTRVLVLKPATGPEAAAAAQSDATIMPADWAFIVSPIPFDRDGRFVAFLHQREAMSPLLMLHQLMAVQPLYEPLPHLPTTPLLPVSTVAFDDVSDESSDEEPYRDFRFTATSGYQPPSMCWAPVRENRQASQQEQPEEQPEELPEEEQPEEQPENGAATSGYQPPAMCWAPARPHHVDDNEIDTQVMPFSDACRRTLF